MGTQVMGAQAGEALVARPAVELDSLDVPMGLEQSLFTLRKESSTQ
jgi:hypothetical protein